MVGELEESIKAKLKELTDNELVELQYAIKHILEERGVSESVLKEAVEKLYKVSGGLLRYTNVVLYLERAGYKRESIAKRVIDMWKKYPFFAESGSPIGEVESDENPIYPIHEGIRYHLICYLRPRWDKY